MARYCDAKDLRALVPDLYRDAALADSAGGTEADAGLLAAVLESACNEVDALVEGRVRLPISTVPRKLRVAAAYIALELLSIRRGLNLREDAAAKVQWWRNWLSKVGEGELRLDAPPPDGAGTASGHASSVAVRPAVTGTHGLMFGLLLAFSLFALVPAETSRAVEARTWAFDLPATADVFDNPAEMEWAAGESLVLSYAGGSLSDGQTARWEVAGGTNLWLSEPGSVSGTTWTWHLAPTQTVFPAGRYAGRIAVYATGGGTTSFHRVAALQSVRVHAGNSGLATVAPLVVRLDDYALRNWVEDFAAALSNALHEAAADLAAAVEGISTNYLPASLEFRRGTDKTRSPVLGSPYYDVPSDVQFGKLGLDGEYIESWGDFKGQLQGPSWLTPARFSWEASVATTVTTNIGDEVDGGWAVLTRSREVVVEKNYLLDPNIERNQWDETLETSVDGPASLSPVGDGTYLLSWADGTATGATATVSGQLGDWRDSTTVTLTQSGGILTQQWFSSFAPGGVWEAINGVYAFWTNRGGTSHRFVHHGSAALTNWDMRTDTNNIWPNTSFWGRDLDWSGVSFVNDSSRPWNWCITLVASNLAYGAAHWGPPVGTTVAWYGKDGAVHASKVVAARAMTYDLRLSKLDPPLDTNAVTAYPILDTSPARNHVRECDTGRGVQGLPPLAVAAMHQNQRAYIQRTGSQLNGWMGGIWDSERHLVPNSYENAIGGDSGHPVFFTTDGTNMVLYGSWWITTGISVPGAEEAKPLIRAAAESMGADPNAIRWEAWTNWPTYLGPLAM